jgi:hypothetical protein
MPTTADQYDDEDEFNAGLNEQIFYRCDKRRDVEMPTESKAIEHGV